MWLSYLYESGYGLGRLILDQRIGTALRSVVLIKFLNCISQSPHHQLWSIYFLIHLSSATLSQSYHLLITNSTIENMIILSSTTLLFAFHLVTFSKAQTTAPFTDPVTGIQFQRFFGAKTQFAFGIALPENPTTDFIGQMTFPLTSAGGWGGIALADDMVGPLLLAAWPNGNAVESSFRLASTEDASPPVANGNFSVVPIPSGTSVNASSMSFTFLCQNCIDSKLGFAAGNTLGTFGMAWALAGKPVSNPADAATELSFHDKGLWFFVFSLTGLFLFQWLTMITNRIR